MILPPEILDALHWHANFTQSKQLQISYNYLDPWLISKKISGEVSDICSVNGVWHRYFVLVQVENRRDTSFGCQDLFV